MKKKVIIFLFITTIILNAAAQESESSDDLDSLFNEENITDIEDTNKKADEDQKAEEDLLVSEGVRWGGSFKSVFTTKLGYNSYPGFTNFNDYDELSLLGDLQATLFFDARPQEDFRILGKFKTAYPFTLRDDPLKTTLTAPNIEVFELFSDFNYRDMLFFRVGKHTIKWGVGYFFSPADVLSLTPIDITDPTAEREGPISLKTQIPFYDNNFYLYLIANNITTPDKIAIAPKIELVTGSVETTIAGFYRYQMAPRGILMMTGSISDFNLFGEAVLSYGSDKTFISGTYTPYSRTSEFFFSGTIGASYINVDLNLMLFAQYFFNGEGYPDSTLLLPAYGVLPLQDLANFGMHYVAFSASWIEIANGPVSLSLLYIGNFSDMSGLINPSISYKFFDFASVSLGSNIYYGDDGDEFIAPVMKLPEFFNRLEFYLQFTLGTGKF
ncbi:MAG: hypothetical protein JW969_00515 [Spirochaetales bacterium]|nr:hypothetical protein [Spirochaetales bacterium]